jgi:hypothetical protein
MNAASQQSEMVDRVYRRLADFPVSAAEIVLELRTKWGPTHNVGEVHRFVEEVAACVLRHDDVEVGDTRDGEFRSLRLEPWDAHAKLAEELLAMNTFLDDKERYVFRKRRA